MQGGEPGSRGLAHLTTLVELEGRAPPLEDDLVDEVGLGVDEQHAIDAEGHAVFE